MTGLLMMHRKREAPTQIQILTTIIIIITVGEEYIVGKMGYDTKPLRREQKRRL